MGHGLITIIILEWILTYGLNSYRVKGHLESYYFQFTDIITVMIVKAGETCGNVCDCCAKMSYRMLIFITFAMSLEVLAKCLRPCMFETETKTKM